MAIKIALLGFGTVGEGVYRTVKSHQEELKAVLGDNVEIAAVLIKNKQKKRDIDSDVLITDDFEDILRLRGINVVMEAIVEREPTFTYLEKAIEKGCHIITANKEMFAHHGPELKSLAAQHGVSVGFEATVGGGIPVIQTLQQLLAVNRVRKIEGIVNGTSNYILTEMREKQQSFGAALAAAQVKGYAEADPTNDVDGYDALYKLMILSDLAFGEQPEWSKIERKGIRPIRADHIEEARALGLRLKVIASIERKGGELVGSVKPVAVSESHPFYNIEGVENAINIQTDIVGSITLQGPGAGMFPTGSAMIEDLVHVNRVPVKRFFARAREEELVEESSGNDGEHWLILSQVKNLFHTFPSITIVENKKSGVYLIQAERSVVEELLRQYPRVCCFPVSGELKVNRLTRKKASTI